LVKRKNSLTLQESWNDLKIEVEGVILQYAI